MGRPPSLHPSSWSLLACILSILAEANRPVGLSACRSRPSRRRRSARSGGLPSSWRIIAAVGAVEQPIGAGRSRSLMQHLDRLVARWSQIGPMSVRRDEIWRGQWSAGGKVLLGSTRAASATFGCIRWRPGWPRRGLLTVAKARRRWHSGEGRRRWLGGRASGGRVRASYGLMGA